MKIGISTSTFFNNLPTEKMFDLLRTMRVDTTEVCLNTFSEYDKSYVDHVASFRGGMNVTSVAPLSTQFEPQLFSPNMRVRADAEALFKKVCYACFAFGAKYYTFCGPINLGGQKDFEYTHLAQRFSQLADIAASYGVTLSLKNMRWSYAATPEFFKRMLALCPRLCATLDLYNAESAGYELNEFFDACPPPRINLIEVADTVKGEWCLPGRGKYNFERLFADIDRRKIFAPVLIAARNDCYSDYLQVRESYERLEAIAASQKYGRTVQK